MNRSRLPGLILIAALAGSLGAATLRVGNNGYATLQAAHDAASPGDRIVITEDTPGATLSKPLSIQGTGGATVGCITVGDACSSSAACAIFGAPDANNASVHTAGLVLKAAASGTLIRNVTIGASSCAAAAPNFGIVTGGTIGCASALSTSCFEAASNVTVKQSTVLETFQGISGTCSHIADSCTGSCTPVCPLNWTVIQNEVTLNSGSTTPLFAYIGITPFDGASGWNITHNVVTRPPNAVPALSSTFTGVAGIEPFAANTNISGTDVNQNKVSVQAVCPGFGACGLPVPVGACLGNNDGTTVAYNDLRGSDNRTVVYAFSDPAPANDLTGLHQYDFGGGCGPGLVTNLTALGNLSSVDPNRGSTSGSLVLPSAVLPHKY